MTFFWYQFILLWLFAVTGTTVAASVKVVRQGEEALVEILGKYDGKKLEPGLTFITPFIEQVAYKQTLREQILEMPPTQCITSDRIAITVDFVVYWRIMDLEKASYKVEDLKSAMMNLLLTQIRSEMAILDLDEIFTSRARINEDLVQELDIATESWGVKITRMELRDFTIGNKINHEALDRRSTTPRLKQIS